MKSEHLVYFKSEVVVPTRVIEKLYRDIDTLLSVNRLEPMVGWDTISSINIANTNYRLTQTDQGIRLLRVTGKNLVDIGVGLDDIYTAEAEAEGDSLLGYTPVSRPIDILRPFIAISMKEGIVKLNRSGHQHNYDPVAIRFISKLVSQVLLDNPDACLDSLSVLLCTHRDDPKLDGVITWVEQFLMEQGIMMESDCDYTSSEDTVSIERVDWETTARNLMDDSVDGLQRQIIDLREENKEVHRQLEEALLREAALKEELFEANETISMMDYDKTLEHNLEVGKLQAENRLLRQRSIDATLSSRDVINELKSRIKSSGDTVDKYAMEITHLFDKINTDTKDMPLKPLRPRTMVRTGTKTKKPNI